MFSKAAAGGLAAAVLFAMPALADNRYERNGVPVYAESEFEYAEVVGVNPVMRQIRVSVPRQECYIVTQYVPMGRSGPIVDQPAVGQMILGGLIGAAVGHQFGHGDERGVGTVVGAVIGTAIGHDVARRRSDEPYGEIRPVNSERCETRYEERYEQQVDSYRVTYRYNGRLYSTQLSYDPGERIRVRVSADPLEP
jgi:uncharacterized protein YcfJ